MPSPFALGLMGAAQGFMQGAKTQIEQDQADARDNRLLQAKALEARQLEALKAGYQSAANLEKIKGQFAADSVLQNQKDTAAGQRSQAEITSRQNIADAANKTRLDAARISASRGGLFGDEGNKFTPDALQMLSTAAEQGFNLPIPSVGMGGAARVQYVNGLAAHVKEGGLPLDLALQTMRFGLTADPAIKQSQKLYSTTKTLEAGADSLAQQAADLSKTVGRGQIPIFNAWVNAGRRATSDQDIARFDRAINAFTHDYAKVVSGSLGSSPGTDAAIAEAKRQLMASNSPEVFAANVDQMQKEMHARTDGMLDSIRKQVTSLSNRGLPPGANPAYTSGVGFGTAPPTAPGPTGAPSIAPTAPVAPTAPASSPYQEGQILNGPGGKYVVRGGVPVLMGN